jgi:hypothetical protein
MRDSVVVFGSAKTINAGISLIKSADFSAEAFISASFNPFKVLDLTIHQFCLTKGAGAAGR